MAIKITYSDAGTEQVYAELTVSDEQVKALSTDMVSSTPEVVFLDWLNNAIENKARQMIDKICEEALGSGSEKVEPLSASQKQQIAAALSTEGVILTSVKQMPRSIKDQIIEMAKIKTAAERQAELEAEIGK